MEQLCPYDLDDQIGTPCILESSVWGILGYPSERGDIEIEKELLCYGTGGFFTDAILSASEGKDELRLDFPSTTQLKSFAGMSGSPVFQFGFAGNDLVCSLSGMVVSGGEHSFRCVHAQVIIDVVAAMQHS